MELHAILAVLLGHACLHANVVGIFAIAAAIFHRSDTLAMLLNHPRIIDIHDRYADRSNDNATRDWKESMHSQRRGERGR